MDKKIVDDSICPGELPVPVWWSNGVSIFRREALPENHPEHPYNYIKRTFGVDPEEYGVFKKGESTCPTCGQKLSDIFLQET